jgi:pyridoxamine 5'-phosphate oxidase-like protein
MSTWAELEQTAPALAGEARSRIEEHGFMLLGTIRRDGTPRISPVEVRLVLGELAMCLVRGSTKALDVARDPRVVLHSPILDADDPNSELKLCGRLAPATDEAVRDAAALWSPPPDFDVFVLDMESVALVEWSKGQMSLQRWP